VEKENGSGSDSQFIRPVKKKEEKWGIHRRQFNEIMKGKEAKRKQKHWHREKREGWGG